MLKPLMTGRDEAAAASAERTSSGRWALAGLSMSMLLSSLGTSIANVALPTLAHSFSASFQEVQWVVLPYLLAITALIVGVARIGDITGRKRLLLAGIFLFTAASVLCGVAPTLHLLIAARAAQGLGATIMMALTMAFIGQTVPTARTGSAMGLLGTMSAMGRGSFGRLNVALLLAAVCGVGSVRARRGQRRITADPIGDVSRSSARCQPHHERARLDVMMATLVVGPFYLSRALGLDAALVGLVLSVGPIVTALAGVPAGRLADHVRPDERGPIAVVLNLSRNLGLVTGASMMGALFAFGSAAIDITTARPEAVATGMRITFAVAAMLIVAALTVAIGTSRPGLPNQALAPEADWR